MKTFRFSGIAAFISIAIIACLSLTACNDKDEPEGDNLATQQLKGRYVGQASDNAPSATDVEVSIADYLTINPMPMKTIVSRLVSDQYRDEALASLEALESSAVTYVYGAAFSGSDIAVQINSVPVEFYLNYGGMDHRFVIAFSTPVFGLYSPSTRNMSFSLTVQQTTVDNIPVSLSQPVTLKFNLSRKVVE